MKFYVAFIEGCPRMDIAGLTPADASHRAAKVLGGKVLAGLKAADKVKFKQVEIKVMV